jgi:hypothetical protein
MNRYFRTSLAVCALCAAALIAFAGKSVIAADESVIAMDKALMAAFEKGDKVALNKFLDSDFTWVDRDGIMVVREDALTLGMKPLVGAENDVQVKENKIGDQVDWLRVNLGNKYAAHVWVKRASGWKMIHINEIVKYPREDAINVRPTYAIPCANPCQSVPFRPADKMQAAVLASWQEQISSREQLIRHTDDDQVMVTTYLGETLPRKSRFNGPAEPATGPAVGSAPVLYMRMWTFGPETVMMLACQPSYGGKAFWSSRVFHYQHGIWQMMESYHNTIQASGVMTEVQGK